MTFTWKASQALALLVGTAVAETLIFEDNFDSLNFKTW